ncbi:MAG: type I-C CRISPR-associated protein Cas8c/Csd1 [Bacteroidales bacterium]|nr:type I-C CRISPR-associated protein Cas8c/Csd1 [Bacteroidales bacterium]
MILKSLYDYAKMLGDKIPAEGLELKEIEFAVVIDADGRFIRFESKRIDKKHCASFLVAKGVKRSGKVIRPNTLWDNGKYALGLGSDIKDCNIAFIARIKEIAERHPDDRSIVALVRFFESDADERLAAMSADPLFGEISQSLASNFSFRLDTDDCLIAEKSNLFFDLDDDPGDNINGRCLVTGHYGPIVRLTTATPLPGNSPMAALVSFQKSSGYDSYGKSQTYNAPISAGAEALFSAALKKLLGKDSRNKARLGERIFLFWGSGDREIDHQVEDCVALLLGLPDKSVPDPDKNVDKVSKLFKSIFSGDITTTLDDRFHILGLAPYTGRIAAVLWVDCTLREFAGKIFSHMRDMEIIDDRHPDRRRPFVGVYSMISAVTRGGKLSDSIPKLAESVTEAVINGTPYPVPLFTSALERIRAELTDYPVSVQRAAILKAYINRKINNSTNNKPLQTMLDKTNDNPGYLCGRLTAVLEKIQKDAGSGDSIRSRYMGSASATPAAVFPSMLNVSVHHSDKLSEGSRIFYEQLKQEIIDKLPVDGFPTHLDLNDQGRFFVGYYHQRTDLFTKKEN